MFKGLRGFFSRLFGSNPRSRGRLVAIGALVSFNSPGDLVKISEIGGQLRTFLNSGRSMETEVIRRFSVEAARKLDVNPILFKILVMEVTSRMDSEHGNKSARLFVEGIVDALDMVGS